MFAPVHRHPLFGHARSVRVERVGIRHFPAIGEDPERYFLSVTHPGGTPTQLPGWSANREELKLLGDWLRDNTGLPFDREPSTSL